MSIIKDVIDNKKISLALDSGSAKGMAHIGVIETLEKEGYQITAVAGTSMGAIVAAYYCLGKLDVLKSWLTGLNKKSTFMTLDFSFSGGFIGGKKLMQAFEEHLGEATFADTKIPLYITATNLDTGKERIFSEGSIIHAIRASISVPGVMRPYLYEGNYYVDGAVTNPLPVDVLHNNKHKNIVAVHLHEYIEERDSSSAPGVLETMSRSMGIVSRYLAKAKIQEAVAVIEPNVAGIDMFHFYQAQVVIERGAQAAKSAVEQGALDSIALKILNNFKEKISNRIIYIMKKKLGKNSSLS